MAHTNTFDDSDWGEVMNFNGYAVFMGYLMMGVRGLGLLVITWTTVVLLGGFVSVLGTKDFWCLAGITLVQTAGVLNFLLEEAISDSIRSLVGMVSAVAAVVIKPFRKGKLDNEISKVRIILTFVLSAIQALMLVIILFPVVVLYMLGVYISAGIGLWRLIEHDFSSADGGAKLKPALEVLYGLAAAQGVLYSYKIVYVFGAKFGIAKLAGEFDHKELVSAYLEETVAGCEKDPSFARGRNLVTYAVDLMMNAKSNDGFISGIKLLGSVIYYPPRKVLAKHLLTSSASWTHMIQRVLDTLGSRSPYSAEVREHAARIVALVASSIRLEQYPGCIEGISSLLDTFEEYSWVPEDYKRDPKLPKDYEREWLLEGYERNWLLYDLYSVKESNKRREDSTTSAEGPSTTDGCEYYGRLVRQGFIILQKLAVREDNCEAIMNAEDLLMKITAPLISQQKLHVHEDPLNEYYSNITEESMMLMMQLMATPGNIRSKLCSEILGRKEEISNTLDSIIKCPGCDVAVLKRRALETLLHLSVDTSSIAAVGSSAERLTWILLLVFLSTNDGFGKTCPSTHLVKKSSYIRRIAGEKLSDMLSSSQEPSSDMPPLRQSDGGSARSMLQSVRIVLREIITGLVDAGNISNRIHAANALQHLCAYHTQDDEYLKELKTVVTHVMPEVLREVMQVVARPRNIDVSLQDIESGPVSQGNGRENLSSSYLQNDEQREDSKVWEVFVRLCWTILKNWSRPSSKNYWSTQDADFGRQLDDIAKKICLEQRKPVKRFISLLIQSEELRPIKKREELATFRENLMNYGERH